MRPLTSALAAALLATAAAAQARYHLDDVVLADGATVTGSFEYFPASGYGDVQILVSGPSGTSVFQDPTAQASSQLLMVVADASLPNLAGEPVFLASFNGNGALGVDTLIDFNLGYSLGGVRSCGDPDCLLVTTAGNEPVSGRVLLLGAAWDNLGDSLAGAGGPPALQGQGSLAPGSTTTLIVSNGTPFATAFWVLGLDLLRAPFKGGVLVPDVDVLTPLPLDLDGSISFGFTWPAGVPSGVTTYHQAWMPEPSGPAGFVATNAISATTP